MSADNQIKKIIIIGATSGIGRKMAGLYAAAGNIVGITGRRKELLDEIENMFPGKIKTECFDVTENENIERLTALIQKIGGLDILVYSSGWIGK
jgi:NADP-dependent 3-hydroxy acid dehydrogenase YdfG